MQLKRHYKTLLEQGALVEILQMPSLEVKPLLEAASQVEDLSAFLFTYPLNEVSPFLTGKSPKKVLFCGVELECLKPELEEYLEVFKELFSNTYRDWWEEECGTFHTLDLPSILDLDLVEMLPDLGKPFISWNVNEALFFEVFSSLEAFEAAVGSRHDTTSEEIEKLNFARKAESALRVLYTYHSVHPSRVQNLLVDMARHARNFHLEDFQDMNLTQWLQYVEYDFNCNFFKKYGSRIIEHNLNQRGNS